MDIKKLINAPSKSEFDAERAWIESECKKLGSRLITSLAKRAAKNRELSYSPYSEYKVGVALLSLSGEIYDGANMERASYSETDHGEESAITHALLHGEMEKSGRRFIQAIAVSHPGKSAPCGRCRQIIVEHCDNALVILVTPEGEVHSITSMKTILPYCFNPSELGKD